MPGFLYAPNPPMATPPLELVVFDKDGTLLDFLKTWSWKSHQQVPPFPPAGCPNFQPIFPRQPKIQV